MAKLLIWRLLTPVLPPYSCPIWSVWSVRTIHPVAIQFLPFYYPAHKKPISTSKPERTNTIQPLHLKIQLAKPNPESWYRFSLFPVLVLPILSYEGNPNKPPIIQSVPPKDNLSVREQYNTSKSIPRCPNLTERPSLLRKTHPQLPQLIQHPDIIPHLLLMPLHLILKPPQPPLTPDIFLLTMLLHLMLPSLYWLEISPPPRPIFWPYDKKSSQVNPLWSYISAWWIHTGTVFVASDLFFLVIGLGECFCFVNVDNNCFK